MTTDTQKMPPDPTPEEFAEAAAWVARLHGPNRTLQTERGLQRWLRAAPGHAAAFEATTAAWEVAGQIPKQEFPRVSRWERAGYRRGFIRAGLAVATIAALAVAAFFFINTARGVVTDIGEQRLVTLDDGTRVFLNTDTRVVVHYAKTLRKVELKRGEAQFDVARNPDRPFVVQVGNQQIRALGTSFVVRQVADRLLVTLIEGKVSVAPLDGGSGIEHVSAETSGGTRAPRPTSAAVTLAAGQRLTLPIATTAPPIVDHPSIEKATAWRRGLLDFDATPFADAASEMNRYSVTRVLIESAAAREIPITGVFRAGDSASFASAVAKLYGLRVIEDEEGIHVTNID